MIISTVTVDPNLPPLMEFEGEQYCVSPVICPFYTCRIKKLRVFVWAYFDNAWLIQITPNIEALPVDIQFQKALTNHHMLERDPLTLSCVIKSLTSEGNPGVDDGVDDGVDSGLDIGICG